MSWFKLAEFFVPHVAKGQPRHRTVRYKNGGIGTYTPDTADGFKNAVVMVARIHKPKLPLDVPVRLDWSAYFPRPKRLLTSKSPVGPMPYPSKPDVDNIAKAIMDCMTADKWFTDDALVTAGTIEKMYVPREMPQVGVKIVVSVWQQ